MKFSIITPTYKRKEKLERVTISLIKQQHSDWEMIIINDSPDDESYKTLTIRDPRIRYYINEKNMGVNFSRNRALDLLSMDSDYVIFLDDDDYLASDTLETLHALILKHPHKKWFVTNRAYEDGQLVTNFPKSEKSYSYVKDVLLLRKCKGDVTHCINTKLITKHHIYFSKTIKQAEEWLFYFQLNLHEKMYYHNHNSTLTDGYDTEHGLNFRKRTKKEQLRTIIMFIREGSEIGILYYPTFIMYLFMRLIRVCIK